MGDLRATLSSTPSPSSTSSLSASTGFSLPSPRGTATLSSSGTRRTRIVMNKWYAKAQVTKDGSKVADVLISTNQQPYKFHVFLPSLLGKLRSGMQEVDVDVAHNPGTSLEMKVNHAGAKFKGFKIAKTGSGSEREIVWNGKKLGSG